MLEIISQTVMEKLQQWHNGNIQMIQRGTN